MVINTSDGPLELPDALIRAATHHAERQADLTVAYLHRTGLFKSKPVRLPEALLLELAAVLELGLWEQQDLRRHLDVDLPDYREAARQLADRCMKGPAEFDGLNAAPLSTRVLRIWMENFAWDGLDTLGAEVVLGNVDENQFANVLADFVWQHRHALNALLVDEVAENEGEES